MGPESYTVSKNPSKRFLESPQRAEGEGLLGLPTVHHTVLLFPGIYSASQNNDITS